MQTRKKLIKASTVVGYVIATLYLLLTACLFSVGNLWYWCTLILGAISLYNSLYSSYLRGKLDDEPLEGKLKIKFLINTIVSIVSLPSFILNIIAYFYNKEDKYLIVKNEEYKEVKKEKTPQKWYKKSNFIVSCIGLGAILIGSFAAQIGETSGYSVSVRDFTLTKEMTDTYNAGDENALNGHNYVISDPVLSYAVTEYRPNTATSENPLPVVIVMPGFTRTKATMSQYAIELSKRNAVVYTIDPGAQGGTTYAGYETNPETGESEMISATTDANGLNYLVQYIYNNTEEFTYIDRNRFGAVGHSAGGGNVCQLAQNFSGETYEDSIIKAVYISGYIKNSAANRFEDLRCNAALSYSYYDEGAFRYQGPTSAFEIIARRFINEVNGEDLGHEKCIIDYEYGSMEEGNYRVVHQEKINHCFEMYDPLSISNTINFFRRSLDLDTNLADSSQTWFVKEGFNGVALVGSFIFIFALMAFLVDILPFFKSFRENAQKAKNYAQKHGFEIKEATITNVNEVQSAIDVLATQCDAVFAPNDNTIASAMNVVSHSCIQSQVPLYVGADSMVQDGGFLSVGIDYEELGRETANMVDQILNGSNVSDIPVKVFKDDLKIYVNQDVMTQIDVELPENIIQDSSLVMM